MQSPQPQLPTHLLAIKALTTAGAAWALVGAGSVSALLASLPRLDDPVAMAALGRTAGALAPRFGWRGPAAFDSQPTSPETMLLAQQEATTHRPVSYSSSPSLPGTLNAPWWTDFAHLIYWFYVVATFTTVAFLGYLYDLLVRRREAAHPIRETRGFSRAQTGDLITAVLPLTWSATMVMHASTHSINFDENTAGAAFSFTVIAYQWGWNYYFPRDVVSQMEAAPRVVGRGRVVSFAPTPLETAEARAEDLWAMRATLGSRHASRTGRLNASAALALTLPTDVPAGALASLPRGAAWRRVAAEGLGESVPTSGVTASEGGSLRVAPVWGLDTTTASLARPSAFVAGDRLVLGHRHYSAPAAGPRSASAALWAATAPSSGALVAAASPLRPALAHLSGGRSEGRALAPAAALSSGLGALRGAAVGAPLQHLLWTGPDALTGAGMTALASTEDMGWLTPVPAREATARATLAARGAWAAALPTLAQEGSLPGPLLLPFDLAARALLGHPAGAAGLGALPASWVGASAALEAEIEPGSLGLWAGALVPDLSAAALVGGAAHGAAQSPAAGLRRAALPAPARLGVGASLAAPAPAPAPSLAGPSAQRLAGVGLPLTPGALVKGAVLRALAQGGSREARPQPTAGAHVAWAGLLEAALVARTSRARPAPSLPGLGLDEARLVRSAASRLSDPALVAGKVDPLAGPTTALPVGPLGLLGLGWSSTASLTTYPSFKVARGGLLRRPMAGLHSAPTPLAGLTEPLAAPFLGKLGAPLGRPSLSLWAPATRPLPGVSSPLDTGVLSWAPTWAFAGPAPAEDLDPTFINTVWTPETNTTRRSDHNTRYLVTWSPLAAPLTRGAALDASASGPGPRGALSPLEVRTSLLALNEAGLKYAAARTGAQARLGALTNPRAGLGASPRGSALRPWPALWAFVPAIGPQPGGIVGRPTSAAWMGGRAATILTAQSRAGTHGGLSPALGDVGSGQSLVSLVAALDLVQMTGPDLGVRARQGYVPLSSSISASRRLRVTKGISLPSDTPMHIICGSKDVIHSWAIPGLGVKIDCIPGYNSHRRLLLRWRGAYWGQCMEVCGRYHHWMPIMVNVVHPALFADWCLTFLRGLDTQAHGGAVGPAPAGLAELLSALGEGA